jgi:hypothetical protein
LVVLDSRGLLGIIIGLLGLSPSLLGSRELSRDLLLVEVSSSKEPGYGRPSQILESFLALILLF